MANRILDLLKFKFRYHPPPIQKKKSWKSGNNKNKKTKDLPTPTPTNTSVVPSVRSQTIEDNGKILLEGLPNAGELDNRSTPLQLGLDDALGIQKQAKEGRPHVNLRQKMQADLVAHGLSMESGDEAMIHPAFQGSNGLLFDDIRMCNENPPITDPMPIKPTRE